MTQMSGIFRGQPVSACPEVPASADKWALLDALTLVADRHGLSHRTLSVLRALLTFFPSRDLPGQPGAAVVYPSNRTLSARLNGIPESTLRRHLAALVRSGVIVRRDSANRKRFARFGGVVFGFDLSPLARAAADLAQAAQEAREEAQRVEALRARLAAARQRALDEGMPEDELEEVRLSLRRKLSSGVLERLVEGVETRLAVPISHVETPEPGATDSRNERHIQVTNQSGSVREEACGEIAATEPDLAEVLESCEEFRSFFPEPCRDWRQVVSVADRVHGMLGIDAEVYQSARTVMGERGAAVTVLCMLERLSSIQRPGAYLRGLVQRAGQGRFNLPGLLRSARLSADNLKLA